MVVESLLDTFIFDAGNVVVGVAHVVVSCVTNVVTVDRTADIVVGDADGDELGVVVGDVVTVKVV